MVVISKLFPLVCFSWICEIPCRTKPPLKLVTEFVTEFCDRTQTSQSAGLWPISLSSQVPPSWTPPPPRSACFFTIIFLPAFIIIICPQDFWPLASSSHTPPFLPTVMSDCEGGGRREDGAAAVSSKNFIIGRRTSSGNAPTLAKDILWKVTKIEEFGAWILFLTFGDIFAITYVWNPWNDTFKNILADNFVLMGFCLFSTFPISSF